MLMPIDYKKYPANWNELRAAILKRAGNRCELCNNPNKEPHWKTGNIVVLTIHHITCDITDNRNINLIAVCQRCHLRLDMPFKIKPKKETPL
jgi:5-methylcytosine-specific restriction endonuclease McrA